MECSPAGLIETFLWFASLQHCGWKLLSPYCACCTLTNPSVINPGLCVRMVANLKEVCTSDSLTECVAGCDPFGLGWVVLQTVIVLSQLLLPICVRTVQRACVVSE